MVSSKQYIFNSVDIGRFVSGSTVVPSVLVIEQAEDKSLKKITQEVIEKAPMVREENERMLADLRRRGWLVSFGWLRRLIVRTLM
jgi:hypothetical protein